MTPDQLIKRHEKAEQKKRPWLSMWQDCVDFSMPMRDDFFSEDAGHERMDRVYDETAIVALQEYVSIMQNGMMPENTQFFMFDTVIPTEDKTVKGQLYEVSKYVYDTMAAAYFDNVGAEVFYDVAIGTGCVHTTESFDTAVSSIKFETLGLSEYSMDAGPFGMPDGRFREIKVDANEITTRWPDAKLTKAIEDKIKSSNGEEVEVELLESTYRDWQEATETWKYVITCLQDKQHIYEKTESGHGCEPVASGRWSKAGREIWGRGPLINALPAIRSLNLTYELLFEAAEMNIGGVWQYESNGIINPDNIRIVPGTLIPTEPNTKGLSAVQSPGRFDLAQIILRDQQEKVKRALYNQDFGPTAQTPRSATEVAERAANLNKLIGSSHGRLMREMVDKIIMRTVHLLKKQGKIELPKLDGRELRIRAISPMARFSKRNETQVIQETVGQIAMIYGPEVAMLTTKVPDTIHEIAKFNDFPIHLLNSKDEIGETFARIMQGLQQASEQPTEGQPQ